MAPACRNAQELAPLEGSTTTATAIRSNLIFMRRHQERITGLGFKLTSPCNSRDFRSSTIGLKCGSRTSGKTVSGKEASNIDPNKKACRGRRCGRLLKGSNSSWEEDRCCSVRTPLGGGVRHPEIEALREEMHCFDALSDTSEIAS